MEIGQINCLNLGMIQDSGISKLLNGEVTLGFAFENFNIRVTSIQDNTKFEVTNEKSTKFVNDITGTFIGGCTLNNYLILFIKESTGEEPDCIYRIQYTEDSQGNDTLDIYLLYKGNLNFSLDNPIEAIGYYEAKEVLKIYWVDGLNQNRFINIVEPKLEDRPTGDNKYPWDNNSFDFQGNINNLPQVKITKNYNKTGFFQAGIIQYFITFYNRYGVETCLVYNSDLQYVSPSDRGGKADEAISCGFDFEITNLNVKVPELQNQSSVAGYDFMRIYASYRSGMNGVVNTRIVTDIDISNKEYSDTIYFTDLGTEGLAFNSDDLFYVGGQKIIANTLDYKLDTLFLGDITNTQEIKTLIINRMETPIEDLKDADGNTVSLKEPSYNDNGVQKPILWWSYKYVSPVADEGIYSHTQEINNSQKDIAGFKWREVYRFGIQFMNNTGEWTSVYWLGDKYCDCPPRYFTSEDMQHYIPDPENPSLKIKVYWDKDELGNYYIPEKIDNYGNIVDDDYIGLYTEKPIRVDYTKDGCYIANLNISIFKLKEAIQDWSINFKDAIAYRIVMVEPDITNRRVIEQGVINPTMFNYYDRYYNQPFSIPSYLFRPRLGGVINRHYDTLPPQIEHNAELMGIVSKKVPGYKATEIGTMYNSYMFIYAANTASIWSGFEQWKLIYYNAGNTDEEKAEKLILSLYTGSKPGPNYPQDINDVIPLDYDDPTDAAEIDNIASLIWKYANPANSSNPNYVDIGLKHPSFVDEPSLAIFISGITNVTETVIKNFLIAGYVPVYIYGNNYKVISSHIENDETKTPLSWDELNNRLITKITEDMRNTVSSEVGTDLAGKIILTPSMLPTSEEIKQISKQDSNASEIALYISAGLLAAAAVVISALSFGTLAAPAAIAAAAGISAITGTLASGAIGCASLAASELISLMSDIAKTMALKGYLSINSGGKGTGLEGRKQRSKEIGMTLEKLFTVGYKINGEPIGIYLNWSVPILLGDITEPFLTGRPYTAKGFIGEDYNAFAITGKLTDLTAEESDTFNKQNLFCVDESILTLNSPTIEETYHTTDNSESLNFDLIGTIPVNAAYGTYDLQVSNGLNSGSMIIPNRNKIENIQDASNNVYGMINGEIYQDYKAEESNFDTIPDEPLQVNENIGTYRLLLWHRDKSAGFWFPNYKLTDGTGADVLEPRSRLIHKVFANLKYSRYTKYAKPMNLDIEKLTTCLDSEVILKQFNYNGDTKSLYKNVNTISINNEAYPLIVDKNSYPSTETRINNGGIKDPVSIRFRTTPFITIPLKWINNGSTILPYLDSKLMPEELYTSEQLKDITLYGTLDKVKSISTYHYISVPNVISQITDYWNRNNKTFPLDLILLNKFHTITDNGTSYKKLVVKLEVNNNDSSKTDITYSDGSIETIDYQLMVVASVLIYSYLFQASATSYYCLIPKYTKPSFGTLIINILWYSIKISSITLNSKIYIEDEENKVYYATKNLDSTIKTIVNLNVANIYDILDEYQYGGTWNQDLIRWNNVGSTPFLFIGELTKKIFDYSIWNGGNEENKMYNLRWIPICDNLSLDTKTLDRITPLSLQVLPNGDVKKTLYKDTETPIDIICNNSLRKSYGDTYYQRWDCEKVYPYTEEDANSNVEVLSFMLESHTNLDGRCDVNRGINNLVNLRPSNTLHNQVYSQLNNFFNYHILNNYLNKTRFEADVLWSLSKNNLDIIDKWTNLVATNEMSLDGRYGTIRKILNVNDVLIAFLDRGMSAIKYNESAALNTTSGLPLQMGNTGKVDGYRMISDTIGCHNKFSINKNSSGVYFCDDNTKTFNGFSTNEGIKNLGFTAEFSTWFKVNLNNNIWTPRNRNNFRSSYDEVNHDLYLIKNDKCLVFNTLLNRFISFMSYINTPIITNLNKILSDDSIENTGLFAIRSVNNGTEVHQLHALNTYGYIYNQYEPYYMDYRVTPNPNHDSIFTNYQYTADWINPNKDVDNNNQFENATRRFTTFDTIKAWNEYQLGEMNIETARMGIHNIKTKFRIWRGNIPRDGSTLNGIKLHGDRMRNPWIHVKFTKSNEDDSKMIFHNLIITYYNQYGRF